MNKLYKINFFFFLNRKRIVFILLNYDLVEAAQQLIFLQHVAIYTYCRIPSKLINSHNFDQKS